MNILYRKTNLLSLILIGVLAYLFLGNQVQAQINLSEPGDTYEQGFENITSLAEIDWSVENINEDTVGTLANTWSVIGPLNNGQATARTGSNCAGYFYNSQDVSIGADDWLFSPAFVLAAGQTYDLSFFYATMPANGGPFPERLSLHLGTAPQSDSMQTLIFDYGEFDHTDYLPTTQTFTVPESGTYYIGWYAYSRPDQYILRIDDLLLSNSTPFDNDLATIGITTSADPRDCNTFTASTPLSILFGNVGNNDQDTFNIEYSVSNQDGLVLVSGAQEALGLDNGDTLTVNLSVDLSSNGFYIVQAITSLKGDQNPDNDTLTAALLNPRVDLTADESQFQEDFENIPSLGAIGWTTENANNDEETWTAFSAPDFANSGSNFIINFRAEGQASDDWLYSNCLDLRGGETYQVRFFARANGGTTESFEIQVGTSPSASAMTLIESYPNFSTNSYTEFTEIFSVPTDGTYYLGWHMTTPDFQTGEGSGGILLDDISVIQTEGVTALANNLLSKTTKIGPNPTSGQLTVNLEQAAPSPTEIQVLTQTGQVVYEVATQNTSRIFDLDLSLLPAGLYLLKVQTTAGVLVKKVMVE